MLTSLSAETSLNKRNCAMRNLSLIFVLSLLITLLGIHFFGCKPQSSPSLILDTQPLPTTDRLRTGLQIDISPNNSLNCTLTSPLPERSGLLYQFTANRPGHSFVRRVLKHNSISESKDFPMTDCGFSDIVHSDSRVRYLCWNNSLQNRLIQIKEDDNRSRYLMWDQMLSHHPRSALAASCTWTKPQLNLKGIDVTKNVEAVFQFDSYWRCQLAAGTNLFALTVDSHDENTNVSPIGYPWGCPKRLSDNASLIIPTGALR